MLKIIINKRKDISIELYKLIHEKKDYERALDKLKKSLSEKDEFSNSKNFILFSIQLIFLKRKYSELINKKDTFIEVLKKFTSNKDEIKYYKCFIHNLIYVSTMLEKKYDIASESKYLFHKINVNLDIRKVSTSIMDVFPIYSSYLLKELLFEKPFINFYSVEELKYVANCDIFVNSEELVNRITDEYIKNK